MHFSFDKSLPKRQCCVKNIADVDCCPLKPYEHNKIIAFFINCDFQ